MFANQKAPQLQQDIIFTIILSNSSDFDELYVHWKGRKDRRIGVGEP